MPGVTRAGRALPDLLDADRVHLRLAAGVQAELRDRLLWPACRAGLRRASTTFAMQVRARLVVRLWACRRGRRLCRRCARRSRGRRPTAVPGRGTTGNTSAPSRFGAARPATSSASAATRRTCRGCSSIGGTIGALIFAAGGEEPQLRRRVTGGFDRRALRCQSGSSSSSARGSTTAPEMPWLPISPPFSITITESSSPRSRGQLAQADRAGETRRARRRRRGRRLRVNRVPPWMLL